MSPKKKKKKTKPLPFYTIQVDKMSCQPETKRDREKVETQPDELRIVNLCFEKCSFITCVSNKVMNKSPYHTSEGTHLLSPIPFTYLFQLYYAGHQNNISQFSSCYRFHSYYTIVYPKKQQQQQINRLYRGYASIERIVFGQKPTHIHFSHI